MSFSGATLHNEICDTFSQFLLLKPEAFRPVRRHQTLFGMSSCFLLQNHTFQAGRAIFRLGYLFGGSESCSTVQIKSRLLIKIYSWQDDHHHISHAVRKYIKTSSEERLMCFGKNASDGVDARRKIVPLSSFLYHFQR
jgi:hypothetical protein